MPPACSGRSVSPRTIPPAGVLWERTTQTLGPTATFELDRDGRKADQALLRPP